MSSLCWPSAGGGVSMRGPPWAKVKAATGTREAALDAVGGGMAMDDAAGLELRVGQRLAHGAHARRRHVAGLQERLPFVGGAREHDLRQHGDLALVIGVALVVGALDHVGAPQHRPQPALLAQVAGAQHHQPVPGLERAVGGVRDGGCRGAWDARRCAGSR